MVRFFSLWIFFTFYHMYFSRTKKEEKWKNFCKICLLESVFYLEFNFIICCYFLQSPLSVQVLKWGVNAIMFSWRGRTYRYQFFSSCCWHVPSHQAEFFIVHGFLSFAYDDTFNKLSIGSELCVFPEVSFYNVWCFVFTQVSFKEFMCS